MDIQEYLQKYHTSEVESLIHGEFSHPALPVDLTNLKENSHNLYKRLTYRVNVWEDRPKWVAALNSLQKSQIAKKKPDDKRYACIKIDFPVTFVNLPSDRKFKLAMDFYKFVQITGDVRKTQPRQKKEHRRFLQCRKCKEPVVVDADRIFKFSFDEPERCTKCKGLMFNPDAELEGGSKVHCIAYQEISVKIQEEGKPLPHILTVELDEELVDTCVVGNQVTICGTLETRSPRNLHQYEMVLRAVSLKVHENIQNQLLREIGPIEMRKQIREVWEKDLERCGDELKVRDEFVSSVAPDLEGLNIIKLGLLLVMCSGETGKPTNAKSSETTRDICHMLMIGDPGLGKSQILTAATQISTNGIKTVGYAITTAGLTANYYKEDGTTHIEAGALVKANQGVCCIDELNFLTKEHRGSIHDVMESQKIVISKGGLQVELDTKCSIIAGMNQKDPRKPLEAQNLAIEQSLLSRFDLIFAFEDIYDPENVSRVASSILNKQKRLKPKWELERMQAHILVAKSLKVEISMEAHEILKRYFVSYYNNEEVEPSRRTMRFLDSLMRLVVCHAKLMLREKAGIIDAIAVIMIFESSWSSGKMVKLPNPLQTYLPLGPTSEFCASILEKLGLEELVDIPRSQHSSNQQPRSQVDLDFDIDKMFADELGDFAAAEPESMDSQPPSAQPRVTKNKIKTSFEDCFDDFQPQSQFSYQKENEAGPSKSREITKPTAPAPATSDFNLSDSLLSLAEKLSARKPSEPASSKAASVKSPLKMRQEGSRAQNRFQKFQFVEKRGESEPGPSESDEKQFLDEAEKMEIREKAQKFQEEIDNFNFDDYF